jgi:hypothetical protein
LYNFSQALVLFFLVQAIAYLLSGTCIIFLSASMLLSFIKRLYYFLRRLYYLSQALVLFSQALVSLPQALVLFFKVQASAYFLF